MASISEYVGLGVPVMFAGVAYGLFHWLDEKASDEAKAALGKWSRSISYDRNAAAAAIVELFDRIYGSPLSSWRSLARSSAITATLTLTYAVLYTPMFGGPGVTIRATPLYVTLPATLIFNILTDYISLFIVRQFLQIRERSQFLILVGGAFAGMFTILFFYFLRDAIIAFIGSIRWGQSIGATWRLLIGGWRLEYRALWTGQGIAVLHSLVILPALVTHIWLLLLAVAVALVRASRYFFLSVEKVQWVLKKGDEHPLEAAGYVAAVVVFFIGAASHLLFR
jgi:hypothetical protein